MRMKDRQIVLPTGNTRFLLIIIVIYLHHHISYWNYHIAPFYIILVCLVAFCKFALSTSSVVKLKSSSETVFYFLQGFV